MMIPYLHIMRVRLTAFLIPVLFISSSGCKKESPDSIAGDLRLEITALHHSWAVPDVPVYIKKNAVVFPGEDTSLYESGLTTDEAGKAVFESLHPGDYFVFIKGYDSIWGDTVIGKKSLRIVSDSQVTVPVSE